MRNDDFCRPRDCRDTQPSLATIHRSWDLNRTPLTLQITPWPATCQSLTCSTVHLPWLINRVFSFFAHFSASILAYPFFSEPQTRFCIAFSYTSFPKTSNLYLTSAMASSSLAKENVSYGTGHNPIAFKLTTKERMKSTPQPSSSDEAILKNWKN